MFYMGLGKDSVLKKADILDIQWEKKIYSSTAEGFVQTKQTALSELWFYFT